MWGICKYCTFSLDRHLGIFLLCINIIRLYNIGYDFDENTVSRKCGRISIIRLYFFKYRYIFQDFSSIIRHKVSLVHFQICICLGSVFQIIFSTLVLKNRMRKNNFVCNIINDQMSRITILLPILTELFVLPKYAIV